MMTTPTTTLKMRARLSPPLAAAASILAIFAGGCTSTPKERPVWVVSTSVDPITSIAPRHAVGDFLYAHRLSLPFCRK